MKVFLISIRTFKNFSAIFENVNQTSELWLQSAVFPTADKSDPKTFDGTQLKIPTMNK